MPKRERERKDFHPAVDFNRCLAAFVEGVLGLSITDHEPELSYLPWLVKTENGGEVGEFGAFCCGKEKGGGGAGRGSSLALCRKELKSGLEGERNRLVLL